MLKKYEKLWFRKDEILLKMGVIFISAQQIQIIGPRLKAEGNGDFVVWALIACGLKNGWSGLSNFKFVLSF